MVGSITLCGHEARPLTLPSASSSHREMKPEIKMIARQSHIAPTSYSTKLRLP